MQAEEIIQQKEWCQLTTEEKKFLQPLAGDEQEFNLLKKMLLVADEQLQEVPEPDAAIHRQLRDTVKPPVKSSMQWYYAAAAVLLLAFSCWLLWQPSQKPGITERLPEKDTAAREQARHDDSLPVRMVEPGTAATVQPRNGKKQPKQQKPASAGTYALVNTGYAENTSLAVFVTEVW